MHGSVVAKNLVPNKLLRNICVRPIEIAWGIKGIRGMDTGACVAAVDHTASVPKGPSRDWCRAWDAGCGCLEKVELVGWVLVYGTTEEGEEDQETSTEDEDKGENGEDWACRRCERGHDNDWWRSARGDIFAVRVVTIA